MFSYFNKKMPKGFSKHQKYVIPESEEKFRAVFEGAEDGIFLMSVKGDILDLNKSFARMHGYSVGEMKNINLGKLETPETRKLRAGRIKKVWAGRRLVFEVEHICKNGKKIPLEVSAGIVTVGGQKCILAFHHDVTERRKVEDKLKESEERFRDIFNNSAVGVSLVSLNGRWIEVNNALCKITGYSRKELLSDNFSNITYIDDRPKGPEAIKKMISGKTSHAYIEKRYVNKKGNIVWVYLSTVLVRDSNKKPLYFVTHTEDITKRKEIEEKLGESEEKYRRLFESSKDSVLILDAETGEITDSNPFIQVSLGYSPKELIGKRIFEISPFRNIIENKDKFLELQKKGYVYYDNLPLESKSGEQKNVEFVSNVYLVGGKKIIQCNIRDITGRIKRERQLEQAKNDFLSLASHQLRTPLSATKWVLESLEGSENFTAKRKEKLNNLVSSNERLINLVNDLLDVTKIESGKLVVEKKFIDIKQLVDELVLSVKVLADNYKKNIKIIVPSKLINIYCDPTLVNEALENLLNNAITYSGDNFNNIEIRITEREKDYLISVHNDGVIDDLSLEKIKKFEKFVRGVTASDKKPEGSGLGLYITKNIVEANGGTLWCESDIKSGTNFYFTIVKK
jgi:PAS domain S-box-containing protein